MHQAVVGTLAGQGGELTVQPRSFGARLQGLVQFRTQAASASNASVLVSG